jgi:hypothetical protein
MTRTVGVGDDSRGDGELDGALVLGAVLLTLLHWSSVALRLPLAQSLPGWFLGYSELPFGSVWPLPLLLVSLVGGTVLVFRRSQATRSVLFALFGLGFVLQVGLSALEGRGLDALRDPLVRIGGHGEMFDVAITESSMFDVVENYEAYSASDRLMHYAQSKPPGFIIGYMLTERVASLGQGPDPVARKARAATLGAVGWSLLSFAAVFPLFYFARLYLSDRDAMAASLLYLVVPSVQLINGHLDQVLFPTLAILTLAMAGHGMRSASLALIGGAGAVLAVSTFISFSLLPVVPLVGVVLATEARRIDEASAGRRAFISSGLAFAGCAAAVLLVFYVAFDYDPVLRFKNAMAYHAAWKSLPDDMRTVAYTSILNWIEFGTWLGVPISFAWAGGTLMSLSAFLRREEGPINLLMLGTALVVLLMCAFGRTMAEVARLWMFLVPLICFFTVATVTQTLRGDAARGLVGLIALQAVTVLMLKRFCDI